MLSTMDENLIPIPVRSLGLDTYFICAVSLISGVESFVTASITPMESRLNFSEEKKSSRSTERITVERTSAYSPGVGRMIEYPSFSPLLMAGARTRILLPGEIPPFTSSITLIPVL